MQTFATSQIVLLAKLWLSPALNVIQATTSQTHRPLNGALNAVDAMTIIVINAMVMLMVAQRESASYAKLATL
jgi:hypothetical protein